MFARKRLQDSEALRNVALAPAKVRILRVFVSHELAVYHAFFPRSTAFHLAHTLDYV
jgi:hypothetical protein